MIKKYVRKGVQLVIFFLLKEMTIDRIFSSLCILFYRKSVISRNLTIQTKLQVGQKSATCVCKKESTFTGHRHIK